MNQTQKEILYLLRTNTKERGLTASYIAGVLGKNEAKLQVKLGILQDNNLIECDASPRGRIKRAKITSLGYSSFAEATKIVNKEAVKNTLNDIRDRLTTLERAFEELQRNPSEENKKSFMEKLDTCISSIKPNVENKHVVNKRIQQERIK